MNNSTKICTAVVFCGPSLEQSEVEKIPGLLWKPPAAQGDLLKAIKELKPDAIAIIDGYFDGVPSIWHKEILWALSKGIKVFGSSSMGALRAAETDCFGMVGVGKIYQQFRDNLLEDDDEVAVMHAPSELGYKTLSLPMVNVRATVRHMISKNLVDSDTGNQIINVAKSIFYQQRQWQVIVRKYQQDNGKLHCRNDFTELAEQNYIDQKHIDALDLIEQLKQILVLPSDQKQSNQPKNIDFHFEWSVMWDKVFHQSLSENKNNRADQRIIDELRLMPGKFEQLLTRTQLKQMALKEAERLRISVDTRETGAAFKNLREQNNLFSRQHIDQWLAANALDVNQLDLLLGSDIKANKTLPGMEKVDLSLLMDELRLSGFYTELQEKARQKKDAVNTNLDFQGLKPAILLSWYFEKHLNQQIPSDLDHYIASIGLNNRDNFYQLINHHYLFLLAKETEKL